MTAELEFLGIVANAGLPEPDSIEYEPDSVVFLWRDTGLAVHVDLDRDDGMEPLDDLEIAQIRGLPPDEWPPVW